ncbi:hypothetical protein [Primorskyibacter sp. 2E233]|uniref:hypothetical protein n=1 Tax=Primorskyibacter sp. 2E233 TaxID=3413431 RepID=UPI003BF28B8C
MKNIALIGLVTFAASAASAHPGHDTTLPGAVHYALSPVHGLAVITLAAALWGVTRLRGRRE